MKALVTSSTVHAPSITAFRSELRALLEHQAAAGRSRHVVVLAVDGIPYGLAAAAWTSGTTSKLRSVFPTTSSAGWLSSLTGASVDSHGIPGVAFKLPDRDGELVDAFSYRGPLANPHTGNVFSDATALGYAPVAILGDLEPYDCAWRDTLLRDAPRIGGHRFYTGAAAHDPTALASRIRHAVDDALERRGRSDRPCLLWCFVDVDRRIHRHGYDEPVHQLLANVEQLAGDLADAGTVVVAHSDHGLTPTRHDPEIEQLIERVSATYDCPVGGAGRVRWVYAPPHTEAQMRDELRHRLPASVRLCSAAELFRPGSLAHGRVGEVVLLAEGEEFVTMPGYRFDHGSLTEVELDVPFTVWSA